MVFGDFFPFPRTKLGAKQFSENDKGKNDGGTYEDHKNKIIKKAYPEHV